MNKIEENKKLVTEELTRHFEIIKKGFSFFDIDIIRASEDELAICDADGKLIKTHQFNGASVIRNENGAPVIKFSDETGRDFTYENLRLAHNLTVPEIRHTFNVHPDAFPGDDECWYNLDIFVSEDDNRIKRIGLRSYNAEDEYPYKEFSMSENDAKVSVEKACIKDGSLVRTGREFWYTTPGYFLWPLFHMNECFEIDPLGNYGKNNRHIGFDGCDFSFNCSVVPGTRGLSDEQVRAFAFTIASHPRNKELTTYTLNEFDKAIPGIKQFVSDNSKMYNDLINANEKSFLTNTLVFMATNRNCNFTKTKALKYVPQEEQNTEKC